MNAKRSVQIGSVVAVLLVALVIANQWRDRPQPSPRETNVTTPELASSRIPAAVRGTEVPRPSEPPSAATSAIESADEAPTDSPPAEEELKELVEGIDPLLADKNVIVRAPTSPNGPSLADVELRFRTETADPTWSTQMESQILDQVSQVRGLSLVTLEAECRETICRLKLVYPPGTNALSSSEQWRPVARQLGFGQIVEAATLAEDGVPMSLLYLQRDPA